MRFDYDKKSPKGTFVVCTEWGDVTPFVGPVFEPTMFVSSIFSQSSVLIGGIFFQLRFRQRASSG